VKNYQQLLLIFFIYPISNNWKIFSQKDYGLPLRKSVVNKREEHPHSLTDKEFDDRFHLVSDV